MSTALCIGDVVLVYINNDDHDSSVNIDMGIIKYIGWINGYSMTEYVGIELIESIYNGHNGTINGYKYFECIAGHGIHTKFTNIIRKLAASEVATKTQEIIINFKHRLSEYTETLLEREKYIKKMENNANIKRLKHDDDTLFVSCKSMESMESMESIESKTFNRNNNKKSNYYYKISPSSSMDDNENEINVLPPFNPIISDESLEYESESMPDESTVLCNNSNSVIFENIETKTFMFPVNKGDDDYNKNERNLDIKSRKLSQNKNERKSLQGQDLYFVCSQYVKDNDDYIKNNNLNRLKSVETEEFLSGSGYDNDDETETEETEYTEYSDSDELCDEYDDNDNDNDSFIDEDNVYSQLSSKYSKYNRSPPQTPDGYNMNGQQIQNINNNKTYFVSPSLPQSYSNPPLMAIALPNNQQSVCLNNKNKKEQQTKFRKPVPELHINTGSKSISLISNHQIIQNHMINDQENITPHSLQHQYSYYKQPHIDHWIQQKQQQENNKYYHN